LAFLRFKFKGYSEVGAKHIVKYEHCDDQGVKNTKLFLIASLTLDLAPFFPEPHIYGKLKWMLGGAEGMTIMDWFDLLLKGLLFVLLIRLIYINVALYSKKRY
jgi:hypothetical protein